MLGSIGRPEPVLNVDHCLNLVQLWAWFVPALGYFYRREIDSRDSEWGPTYLKTCRCAEEVASALVSEYNRLLGERGAEYDENGIRKATS